MIIYGKTSYKIVLKFLLINTSTIQFLIIYSFDIFLFILHDFFNLNLHANHVSIVLLIKFHY
jgi:hypothetical protein